MEVALPNRILGRSVANLAGVAEILLAPMPSTAQAVTVRSRLPGAAGMVEYPLVPGDAPSYGYAHVQRTVRIPLDAFTAVNPDLDLSDVQAITLGGLTDHGHLVIDDLHISNEGTAHKQLRRSVRMPPTLSYSYGHSPSTISGHASWRLSHTGPS